MQDAQTIVVVDDDADVRGLIVRILEKAGYCVLSASSGKKALQMIADTSPNLVITDLFMPDMDGFELLRALNEKRPEIRVIVMSGAFEGRYLNCAKLLGAHGVLLKPLNRKTLLASVEAQFGG